MKALTFLSLATAVAFAKDIEYPATLSLQVVFASSKAVKGEPVVFSLRNADKDFKIGYTLDWEITNAKKNYTGTVAVASVKPGKAKDPLDNIWYAAGGIPDASELAAGDYGFKWEWKMMSSIQERSVVTYNIEDQVSTGSANFTVSSGGSSGDKKKQSPLFQTKLSIGPSSKDDATPSKDLSACVNTDKDDKSTCAKLDEQKADKPAGASNSQPGKDDPGSAGTKLSQTGTLALLIALGTALLM